MFIRCTEIIVDNNDVLKAEPVIFEFRSVNVDYNGRAVISAVGGDRYTVYDINAINVVDTIQAGLEHNKDIIAINSIKAVRAVKQGVKHEDVYVTKHTIERQPLSDYLDSKSITVSNLLNKTAMAGVSEQLTEAMTLFDNL